MSEVEKMDWLQETSTAGRVQVTEQELSAAVIPLAEKFKSSMKYLRSLFNT